MQKLHALEKARSVFRQVESLGFDFVEVDVAESEELAVRVADGVVCRENVYRGGCRAHVFVALNGRVSSLRMDVGAGLDSLLNSVSELRQTLEKQQPDGELVIPDTPVGEVQWRRSSRSLNDVFGPEKLFSAIDASFRPIRERGLRGSGFISAVETETGVVNSHGFNLSTGDVGLSAKMMVSHGTASGVGYASLHEQSEQDLTEALALATVRAMQTCESSVDVKEPVPGDVTVILSPSAVRQLLAPALFWYEFCSQRTVDEGRTYLSRAREELRFPESLQISAGVPARLPNGRIFAPIPFNSRGVFCRPHDVIRDGRVANLFCDPFWAKTRGMEETFFGADAGTFVVGATQGSPLTSRFGTLADLLVDTPHAVLVHDLWYIRLVSAMDGVLTGMTRDGLFEVRDGKITAALQNMRWHVNPFEVLTRVTGMTQMRQQIGSGASGRFDDLLALMPYMRCDGFHFSSVTRF